MQYYDSATGEIYAYNCVDACHHGMKKRYTELTGVVQLPLHEGDLTDDFFRLHPPAKLLVFDEDSGTVWSAFKEHFSEGVAPEFHMFTGSPHPFFVEFLPPRASKGAGLGRICDHLGISPNECVAFGDGDNDREFLEIAGVGVAMQNATARAKEVADVILEVNSEVYSIPHSLPLYLNCSVLFLTVE